MWAKFNDAKNNASKTAFTSKKSVSSCCIMAPNKSHMSDKECSVVLKKRNGRHHLYSYKFRGCLESCCHWRKIASLLLIRKLDKTEKDLKELPLEKFTFHSISQQRECSTETCRYSLSWDCQRFPVNGLSSWREKGWGSSKSTCF